MQEIAPLRSQQRSYRAGWTLIGKCVRSGCKGARRDATFDEFYGKDFSSMTVVNFHGSGLAELLRFGKGRR